MKIDNDSYIGANNRKSLIDLHLPERPTDEIVLFIHGYKGYKDWGAWHLVQNFFLDKGIGFAKLNLSHNGGTIHDPIDFPDLEAFGQNRYTYELIDVESAIQWLDKKINLSGYSLTLIGHSRGGGIALLSGQLAFVKRIVTWASISSIPDRFPTGDELARWKKEGVRYVQNGRTKQDMPHYFSFYQDYLENKDLLNIEKVSKSLNKLAKNCLHIHGKQDQAVDHNAAFQLARWTGGESHIIKDTGHTFDTKHPWINKSLPTKMREVCQKTYDFILK